MKKGVILILTCVIILVLLTFISAYFFRIMNEKVSLERDKMIVQAFNLSEAGLNHGIVEFKKKILSDLNPILASVSGVTLNKYVDEDIDNYDSLDFLVDFCGFSYSAGGDDQVELSVSSVSLNTGIPQASYTAKVFVRKQKDSQGNDIEGYKESTYVYKFPYEFFVKSTGTVGSVNKILRLVGGEFTVTVQRGNFARYALFTNHHRTPSGVTVWFTDKTRFYGPVHTNERLSFANNPGAYFADEVTQHLTKARFYNHGWIKLLNADSNPPYDVPQFNPDKGFQRGYEEIVLESAITSNDIKSQALGTMSEPGTNGIYIPNDGANLTGGIYIRGNSSISLSVDNNDNAVYTITQGSTTKIITVDYTNNQTTVDDGVSQTVYSGIPDGIDNEGIIIYNKGSILSLEGTVQKDSQVTISSESDIIITDNIKYQEYNSGVNPDTGLPSPNAQGYTNLLGILSWNGDVRIATSAPNDLEIHGIIMAVHGVFTVDNYRWRPPSGYVTLLGGVITDFYGPFGTFWGNTQLSGFGRNFIYDDRMYSSMAPPYFPMLSYFVASASALDKDLEAMGLTWEVEK